MSSAFDIPIHTMLQCPANETHLRVQQESLSKPHTGTLWPCWSLGAADGGAMKNNGQLLPPFLKVPDMRNPTWLPLLFDVCAQQLRDTESKGHGKGSDLLSHQVWSSAIEVLLLSQAEQGAAPCFPLVFLLLLQRESSSRTEIFWKLSSPPWGHFWLVSAH